MPEEAAEDGARHAGRQAQERHVLRLAVQHAWRRRGREVEADAGEYGG